MHSFRKQQRLLGAASHPSVTPAGLLLLFLLAVGGQGSGAVTPAGETGQPDQDVPGAYIELLGPAAAWQLANLQLAIDLVVENEVAACMREAGFNYEPRSQAELAAISAEYENASMLRYAEQAIASISQSDLDKPGPNQSEYNQLSPAGREEWDTEENRCFVEKSALHENPLVEEGTWFDIATSEASKRTGADSRIGAAQQVLESCFEAGGFGSIQEAVLEFYNAANSIVVGTQNGAVSREQATADLRVLAARETVAADLLTDCQAPYLELEGRVFSDYLSDIAVRDSDRAAQWASEIGAAMRPYLEYLPDRG